MSVTAVNGNTTAANTSNNAITTSTQNILGKDDFLKLLITQLKCQDPLEPVKDQDFIAQMATFSSLEQMNNLNTAFTDLADFFKGSMQPSMLLQQAGSLLGTVVEYTSGDTTKTGLVSSVRMNNGTPVLMVNGEKVDVSSITAVTELSIYEALNGKATSGNAAQTDTANQSNSSTETSGSTGTDSSSDSSESAA